MRKHIEKRLPGNKTIARLKKVREEERFNHHHFNRFFRDERKNMDILRELTGSNILVCAHPLCLSKVRKDPKTFDNATQAVSHHIEIMIKR